MYKRLLNEAQTQASAVNTARNSNSMPQPKVPSGWNPKSVEHNPSIMKHIEDSNARNSGLGVSAAAVKTARNSNSMPQPKVPSGWNPKSVEHNPSIMKHIEDSNARNSGLGVSADKGPETSVWKKLASKAQEHGSKALNTAKEFGKEHGPKAALAGAAIGAGVGAYKLAKKFGKRNK